MRDSSARKDVMSAPSNDPVSPWGALLAIFGVRQISVREVRAEAFFLGNRHKGEIREGAKRELLAPDLDPDRAALLRAVIRMTPRSSADAGDVKTR